MLDLPIIYIFIAALLIVTVFIIWPHNHLIFRETNIKRLEKFLIKQRKKPALYLFYAAANQQDEEVEQLIGKLLIKYKQPNRQALYKAIHGMYRKNSAAVKSEIARIQPVEYRFYYETYFQIEEGDLETARANAAKISKLWMRAALLSEIEIKAGNRSEAISLARQALQSCRGVQRYLLHKNYERELPEALIGA
ncbi:hypothetical protein BK133_19230 [Paenibacillus sp. FSL H8-0548]|nr:hypothetical protein BK133_19230 [Paenibacillus sp. FSL H8-0548]